MASSRSYSNNYENTQIIQTVGSDEIRCLPNFGLDLVFKSMLLTQFMPLVFPYTQEASENLRFFISSEAIQRD